MSFPGRIFNNSNMARVAVRWAELGLATSFYGLTAVIVGGGLIWVTQPSAGFPWWASTPVWIVGIILLIVGVLIFLIGFVKKEPAGLPED